MTVPADTAGSTAVRVTARVTGASAEVSRTRRDEAAVEHTVTATPGLSGTTAVARRGWRAGASPARMSSAHSALTGPVVLDVRDDMREVRGRPVHFRGADKSSLSDPAALTRK